MTAVCSAALALLPACRGERPGAPVAGSWHNEQYAITAGSVSFSGGDALLVTSDSTAELRSRDMESAEATVAPIPPGIPLFESDDPLLTFLYRLEAATDTLPTRGRPYLPYTLYINPLPADRAAGLLAERLRNDLPIPPELPRYSWPVVRDNAQWLMAASETALAGGDGRWTKRVFSAARQLLELDLRMALNRRCGLFEGTPRYLLGPVSLFPDWLQPVDLFQNMTLSENASYHAALSNIERIAAHDKTDPGIPYPSSALRDAVNTRLWNPASGCYGAALYGNPEFPVRLHSADNAAQAVAILGGTASEAMAASIAARTPVGPFGPEMLTPRWNGDSVSANEFPPILLNTLWMAAMSATPNETAYSAAVAALIARRAAALLDGRSHPEMSAVRPIASLVLRGFLGAKFAPEGMYLYPAVPAELSGDKRVTGLRYRGAILNIRITGTGRILSTFTIDGKSAAPFIPADLEGDHEITITLAGPSAEPGEITIASQPAALPPTPAVAWPTPLDARLRSGNGATLADDGYAVYLNGILDQVIISPDYKVCAPRELTSVQFSGVADSKPAGFASAPHIVYPKGWETIIRASDHAVPGTRLINDRKRAAGIVESNRWKNRAVSFRFDAPEAGVYLVDVRYSASLGIVNPHRRTSLRRLKANDVEAGILVFPQYSPAWWHRDTGDDWQLPATYSTQLAVELDKGQNKLELVYFQPSPVYIDPLANALLFDLVRIRRVGNESRKP